MSSDRVSPRLRRFLGQRLRILRKQHGWSQRGLARRARLSGKFIGEVERGEKSISVDSLYAVSCALGVPLHTLTDAPADGTPMPTEDAEKLLALLLMVHRAPQDLRRAGRILRSLWGQARVR